MTEFYYMTINNKKYLGLGFFAEVSPAIVVESDELIGLLSVYKKEGVIINTFSFLDRNDDVIASYQGKYIVDSVQNIEAELFPI